MLKVLHFADLHLGIENYGKLNPKTGLNTRVEDFLAAFDVLTEKGISEKVDLVVFAGDAFRDRNPNPTLQREFAKRISKLVQNKIPVVLLVGNHDLPRVKNRANTLEIYKVLNIPDITVIDSAETVKVKTRKGYVQIVGIPWDYFLNLFLALKAGSKNKPEKMHNLLEEQIKAKINDFAEKLDPDIPSILLAHLPLGHNFGSEQDLEMELDVFLKKEVVLNSHFDYVGLGHMHRFQKLSESPLAIYSGSLERVDFGEKDEDKGFVIIDLPQKKDKKSHPVTAAQFYPTAQRRFIEIEYSLDIFKDPTLVLDKIDDQKTKLNGTIVKVVLRGTKNALNQLDHNRLNDILKTTSHYQLKRVFTDQTKTRSDLTVEMLPLDTLAKYLKLVKTPQNKIETLKKEAQKIINELEA